MSRLAIAIEGDREFDFVGGIDYAHLMKHLGRSFSYYDVDAGFDLADTVLIYFKAPVAGLPLAHIVPIMSNSSAFKIDIIRSPATVTKTGVETVFNDNENSSNTSNSEIQTASAYTGGTIIRKLSSGSTNKIGGDLSRQDEIILGAGLEYVFKIYASGAENSVLNIGLNWYEDILKTFPRS